MNFTDFTAGKNDNDRRIDKIIRTFIKDASLSEIYKSLRKGLIKINKKKCKPETHVFEGDIISIADFLLNESDSEHKDKNNNIAEHKLQIIFENEHLLIINKPYDINVHGDETSLEKQVVNYFNSEKNQSSLAFTPGPLHRLDRKTTGLLAFSMSIEGARWFTENIKNHSIKKIYFSVLQGKIAAKETWKDFISQNENDVKGFHKVSVSDKENFDSKYAETEVTPLAYGRYKNLDVTFTRINIKTGRKHQIRSQSASHKHPLLGDTVYGGEKLQNSKQDFYLHAGKLHIPENKLNIPESIEADLPETFIEFLKYCEITKFDI